MEKLQEIKSASVGYYANTKKWTKVHLVVNGKPVCGCKIKNDMQFQWCANWNYFPYIECEKCKKKSKKLS